MRNERDVNCLICITQFSVQVLSLLKNYKAYDTLLYFGIMAISRLCKNECRSIGDFSIYVPIVRQLTRMRNGVAIYQNIFNVVVISR